MCKKIFLTFIFSILFITKLLAQEITLHISILEDSPKLHLFFHELLEKSLIDSGYTPKLISKKLPHLRLKSHLNDGKLSIHWMLESEERNTKFIPIKVGLTNGLIGKRILLIKKGNQHLFDNVKTLDDFRKLNLVGAIGNKWFDVKVWKENQLRFKEHSGNWKYIFSMLHIRSIYEYFSRGINEIRVESKEYPFLAIEKNLVLIYDRDFIFYLSKDGVNAGFKYKKIIEESLYKAKQSGLIERLVRKYWADDFEKLNYDNRIKLYLKIPK